MDHRKKRSPNGVPIPFFDRMGLKSRRDATLDFNDKERLFSLVRNQLEDLLNTRSCGAETFDENNIVDFGLQDFSYINLNSNLQKNKLIKEIETKVLAFIPLVERVKVVLLENKEFNTLQIVIKAMLFDASEDRVEFQAVLEPKSRVLKVKEGFYHA